MIGFFLPPLEGSGEVGGGPDFFANQIPAPAKIKSNKKAVDMSYL
jgi:hypothetical protein